jgi:hypothetical protein
MHERKARIQKKNAKIIDKFDKDTPKQCVAIMIQRDIEQRTANTDPHQSKR